MIARRPRADASERRLSDPNASRAVLIEAHAFTHGGSRAQDQRSHLEDRPSVEAGCLRLAELLKDPGVWGLPDENCVVVPQPTRDTMLSAVDKAAAAATDTLVVYYAGHGLLYPLSNDLHLAVPETTKDKSYTAVKYEDLREILLSATRVRRKVVILDCCFSGTALRGALSADDAAAVRLAGVEGTSVLAASHATKQALALPGEDYPAFTGELITLLDEGGPDFPELLSMADIFDRVDQALLQKNRPRPQQLNRDQGAHICIARNRAPKPQALSDEAAEARAEAEAAVRRRTLRKRWLAAFAVATALLTASILWFGRPDGNAGEARTGSGSGTSRSAKPSVLPGITCGRAYSTFDMGDGTKKQEVSIKVVHDAACKGDFDAMEVAMDRSGFGISSGSADPKKVIAEWKKRKDRTDFLQVLVTLLEHKPQVGQGGLTFSNGKQTAFWERGAGTQPDSQLRWSGYVDCTHAGGIWDGICDQ